ncbi:hypothetical protein CN918_27070 [Priestia megaterium]|nr:hypothetical protein CN918_27070 [Priestia megaterium]
MNRILILYKPDQANDAEHAKGVLQEELDTYWIETQSKGKETLLTSQTRFIFRDITKPVPQSDYRHLYKIYASRELMEDERVTRYDTDDKIEWIARPTSAIIDYVMAVEEERPQEKVRVYEIIEDKIKEKTIEIYKSKREGYYPSREIAELMLSGEVEAAKALLHPKDENEDKKDENCSSQVGLIDSLGMEEPIEQLELVMN